MTSGPPWKLEGLRPRAREAVREAARRSGMSVREWLNSVAESVSETDEDHAHAAELDREPGGRPRQSPGGDALERVPNPRVPTREAEEGRHVQVDDGDDQRGEREERYGRRWGHPSRARGRETEEYGPPPATRHDRQREAEGYETPPYPRADRQRDRDLRDYPTPRSPDAEPERELAPQLYQPEQHRQPRATEAGRPGANESDEAYDAHENADAPRERQPQRPRTPEGGRESLPNRRYAPPTKASDEDIDNEGGANSSIVDNRDSVIEKAIADITARQQALDDGPDRLRQLQQPQQPQQPEPRRGDRAAGEERVPAPERLGNLAMATPRQRPFDPMAEISARQLQAHREAPASFDERRPAPLPFPPAGRPAADESRTKVVAANVDIGALEEQLRKITARIEALHPTTELENAIKALREELAEIGRSLTSALPRRALESLEIEVKALGERIDHSRQSGVDREALAGVEQGLTEVREALRALTPAENLVGYAEALHALDRKVDSIIARDDPAALKQLQSAIDALHGVVSHVASNDALASLAQDVRELAAKIDNIAATAASETAFSALEQRIDGLAEAISASTAAGHPEPRELERLLAGLIDKLEGMQLVRADQSALAFLDERIGALIKRLDDSDARLDSLVSVERGLADLWDYIDQLHQRGERDERGKGFANTDIGRQVAAIEQTGRRTQDSLETMHGTIEHVVDRLAMIESGMRSDDERAASRQRAAGTPPVESMSRAGEKASNFSAEVEQRGHAGAREPRPPINPNLPPDHPLEPGSAGGRSPQTPSGRLAAAAGSAVERPETIPDAGSSKPDFIAAARRAAQAAAATAPHGSPAGASAGSSRPKTLSERLRAFVVAAAVVAIVIGGWRIASRFFDNSGTQRTPNVHVTHPPAALPEPKSGEAVPAQRQTEEAQSLQITAPPTEPATSAPVAAPAARAPASPPAAAPAMRSGAGQHSLLNPKDAPQSAPATQVGAVSPQQTASLASLNGRQPQAPLDITAALPQDAVQHDPATRAAADRLPAAIGTPAMRDAALAGDPVAAYEVGVRFAEGRLIPANNEAAAHWFALAAHKGLAPAQFRLATLYEKGVGVKKNAAAARDLYRLAADRGHGKAMHNLAVLYAEGINGPPDYQAAALWFRKAAEHGITDSQFNLAVLYARGVGVEKNFAESYKWFSLAAKAGDRDAAQKRDEVASHLDPRALAAARQAAEQWTAIPQPTDVTSVQIPEAWAASANAPAWQRSKPRS
jgi:localization factor PodJL